MKRLAMAVVVLGLAVLSTHAVLAMSQGEKKKLGRYASESLDPFADETARGKAWESFVEYFADRKAKDLAEVADLSEILANAADRKSPGRSGVYESEVLLSEIGMKSAEKWKIAVNVPKKYSGSGDSAWPLIVCIPDKGQDLVAYLDTYWKDPEIRETFLIAVLGFDYSDVTVTEREEVKDDTTGKSEFKDVKKKVPFTWDSLAALQRFWWHIRSLQLRTFKVDPNRIILDGAGFGRDGALSFATGNAWRWAGFVMRGGESDRPTTANLKYLRTLYAAPDGGAVGTRSRRPRTMRRCWPGRTVAVVCATRFRRRGWRPTRASTSATGPSSPTCSNAASRSSSRSTRTGRRTRSRS